MRKKNGEIERGCPPLFLASKGFITLCDNSSWRSSVKSRPLRYPTTSRITMLFTAVSLYPNSNLPLQITPSVHRHNSRPTMKVAADKETVRTDKHTRGNGSIQKLWCRVQESFKLHKSQVTAVVCMQSSLSSKIAFICRQQLTQRKTRLNLKYPIFVSFAYKHQIPLTEA